jgi:hypothetical protein
MKVLINIEKGKIYIAISLCICFEPVVGLDQNIYKKKLAMYFILRFHLLSYFGEKTNAQHMKMIKYDWRLLISKFKHQIQSLGKHRCYFYVLEQFQNFCSAHSTKIRESATKVLN